MTTRIYYNENEFIPKPMEEEPLPTPNLQSNKNVTIENNTTTEITPDTGYDGMEKVTVTTNIPIPTNTQKIKYISSLKEPYTYGFPLLNITNWTPFTTSVTVTGQLAIFLNHNSESQRSYILIYNSVNYNITNTNNKYYTMTPLTNTYKGEIQFNYENNTSYQYLWEGTSKQTSYQILLTDEIINRFDLPTDYVTLPRELPIKNDYMVLKSNTSTQKINLTTLTINTNTSTNYRYIAIAYNTITENWYLLIRTLTGTSNISNMSNFVYKYIIEKTLSNDSGIELYSANEDDSISIKIFSATGTSFMDTINIVLLEPSWLNYFNLDWSVPN